MTRDEQLDLRVLTELFLDFKKEDGRWKERLESRVGRVEKYVTTQEAIASERRDARLSRREKVGLAIAGVSAIGGVVIGIVNALM